MLINDGSAKRVDFNLPSNFHSRAFEAKVNATYPRKKTADLHSSITFFC